jgi:carbonic anhydrase
VVLGHSKCGAVKGACDHAEMGNLTALLAKIRPAVDDELETKDNRNSTNANFVENVAAINVKRTVKSILERSTILEQMIANGEIGIIGGMHDLTTGQVTYYENADFIA